VLDNPGRARIVTIEILVEKLGSIPHSDHPPIERVSRAREPQEEEAGNADDL
jgi:hypothetical protein